MALAARDRLGALELIAAREHELAVPGPLVGFTRGKYECRLFRR